MGPVVELYVSFYRWQPVTSHSFALCFVFQLVQSSAILSLRVKTGRDWKIFYVFFVFGFARKPILDDCLRVLCDLVRFLIQNLLSLAAVGAAPGSSKSASHLCLCVSSCCERTPCVTGASSIRQTSSLERMYICLFTDSC